MHSTVCQLEPGGAQGRANSWYVLVKYWFGTRVYIPHAWDACRSIYCMSIWDAYEMHVDLSPVECTFTSVSGRGSNACNATGFTSPRHLSLRHAVVCAPWSSCCALVCLRLSVLYLSLTCCTCMQLVRTVLFHKAFPSQWTPSLTDARLN
jgi:hypothetical protein